MPPGPSGALTRLAPGQPRSFSTLPHCPGAVGSGDPAVYCTGLLGSFRPKPHCSAHGAVGCGLWSSCCTLPPDSCSTLRHRWLQYTASVPGSSGQWIFSCTLRHCWEQWAVDLEYSPSLLGAGSIGQWISFNTLPHCRASGVTLWGACGGWLSPQKALDHGLGGRSVRPCRWLQLVGGLWALDIPQKAQDHGLVGQSGMPCRWLHLVGRLRGMAVPRARVTKCPGVPVVAPCGALAGDGCGRTLLGACWGWLSPKRCGIPGSGDKVSSRAVVCDLWGACGGWSSPKKHGIHGRRSKGPLVPVVAPCGAPAGDGRAPKAMGSQLGEMKCPGVLVVARCGVPAGDVCPPEGMGSRARGTNWSATLMFARRGVPSNNGCLPKGAGYAPGERSVPPCRWTHIWGAPRGMVLP